MEPVNQEIAQLWAEWTDQHKAQAVIFSQDQAFIAQLLLVWEASEYVRLACERDPDLLVAL